MATTLPDGHTAVWARAKDVQTATEGLYASWRDSTTLEDLMLTVTQLLNSYRMYNEQRAPTASDDGISMPEKITLEFVISTWKQLREQGRKFLDARKIAAARDDAYFGHVRLFWDPNWRAVLLGKPALDAAVNAGISVEAMKNIVVELDVNYLHPIVHMFYSLNSGMCQLLGVETSQEPLLAIVARYLCPELYCPSDTDFFDLPMELQPPPPNVDSLIPLSRLEYLILFGGFPFDVLKVGTPEEPTGLLATASQWKQRISDCLLQNGLFGVCFEPVLASTLRSAMTAEYDDDDNNKGEPLPEQEIRLPLTVELWNMMPSPETPAQLVGVSNPRASIIPEHQPVGVPENLPPPTPRLEQLLNANDVFSEVDSYLSRIEELVNTVRMQRLSRQAVVNSVKLYVSKIQEELLRQNRPELKRDQRTRARHAFIKRRKGMLTDELIQLQLLEHNNQWLHLSLSSRDMETGEISNICRELARHNIFETCDSILAETNWDDISTVVGVKTAHPGVKPVPTLQALTECLQYVFSFIVRRILSSPDQSIRLLLNQYPLAERYFVLYKRHVRAVEDAVGYFELL